MLGQIIAFDSALLHAAQSFASPAFDTAMLAITFLGNPIFWFAIIAFLYWKGRENESFHIANLIALSAIFAGALKNGFARQRPSPQEFRVIGTDAFETLSFPSGHATLITAGFFYFKNFLKKKLQIIFAVIIVLVAFSRMYTGLHYFADVIAGIVLGAFIGIAYFRLVNKLESKKLHIAKSEYGIAIVVLIAAAIALVGILSSIPLGMALIGYYIGFFSLKEIGLHEKTLSREKLVLKQGIGFLVLAGILALGLSNSGIQAIIAFLIAGLWVSLIWPLAFEKVIRHD